MTDSVIVRVAPHFAFRRRSVRSRRFGCCSVVLDSDNHMTLGCEKRRDWRYTASPTAAAGWKRCGSFPNSFASFIPLLNYQLH